MIMIIPVNLSFLLCKLGASISNKAIKTIIVRARSMRCDLVQGGGGLPEKLDGGVRHGTLLETLTLFQTKICDFPYPISDLHYDQFPRSDQCKRQCLYAFIN